MKVKSKVLALFLLIAIVAIVNGIFFVTQMVNAAETEGAILGGKRQVAVAGEYVVVGGDIVIALDGIRIKGIDDLSTFLEECTSPGQLIDATIVRNGVTVTLPVTLGTRP